MFGAVSRGHTGDISGAVVLPFMVTVEEAPRDTLAWLAFLEQRQQFRSLAAQRLVDIKARRNEARAALEAEFSEIWNSVSTTMSKAGRAKAFLTMRAEKLRERAAIDNEFREGVSELRQTFGLHRNPMMHDLKDYLHLRELARTDGTNQLDPVVAMLPNVRRRRDRGFQIYERHGVFGRSTELLRADAERVIVPNSAADGIRAALLLASKRYSPPLRLRGSDEFLTTASAVASELGVDVELPTQPRAASEKQSRGDTPDTAPRSPRGADADVDEGQEDEVEATRSASPTYTIDASDACWQPALQQTGKKLIVVLSELTADVDGTVVDRVKDAWNNADALVLLPPEGMGLVVVPIDPSSDDVALGSTVHCDRSEDNRFTFSHAPDATAPARDPESVEDVHEHIDDEIPEVEREPTPAKSQANSRSKAAGGRR